MEHSNAKRNFCPKLFKNFDFIAKKYPSLFSIDLPAWPSIAINIKAWKELITPCDDLHFMNWAPDVAMQFLSNNYHCAVTKNLYLQNDQLCKEKYGFSRSSPSEASKNSKLQLNETKDYDAIFKKRWGFSYKNVKKELPFVLKRYKNTLVEKYYYHDCRNGPLINFDMK